MYRSIAALIATAMLTAGAAAQNATPDATDETEESKPLQVGDTAPAVDIEHWIKGEPVRKFQPEHVYVVEFWATWCGPCRVTMPHLSELQDQHTESVTIIGISNEPKSTVTEFLSSTDRDGVAWQDKIRYRLTTDPDKSTWNDYFYAAGRRGIPSAFIVGKTGEIEWIGHPIRMDEPLKKIAGGSWDRQAFLRQYEREQQIASLRGELYAARRAEDWSKAWDALEKMEALSDEPHALDMDKFTLLVGGLNKPEAGYKLGREIVKRAWDDASMLNMIAWFIVDDASVQQRDLKLAMKAAKRGSELTDDKNAAILDTLARVHYKQGDLATAAKWQAKAVAVADNDRMGASLRETLATYEAELANGPQTVKR